MYFNNVSLSHVIASIFFFWWGLIKINMKVNGVQLRKIKGEKIQYFFIDTSLFWPEKFHMIKNKHQYIFKMGNVYFFFFIQRYSWHLAHFLTLSSRVLLCFCKAKSTWTFYFWLCIETWMVEGRFKLFHSREWM